MLADRAALEAAADRLGLSLPADPEPAYEGAATALDLEAVSDRLQSLTDATDVVVGAAAAAGHDYGFWTDWGLRGVDLVAEYQDVRDAFVAGDVDLVVAEAAEIDMLVSEAAGKAKRFWGTVAAASLAVLVVVLVAIIGFRRRRRRRLAALTIPDTVGAPDYRAADGAVEPVSSANASLVGAGHAGSGDPQHEAHQDERGPAG